MTHELTRRRFLAGAAAGIAVLAGACSDGDDAAGGPDLDLAAGAAGMEKLFSDTYDTMAGMATGGRVGALVPPAVAAFVHTAAGHHRETYERWNALLLSGGRQAVAGAGEALTIAVNTAVTRVVDIPMAVTLALRLEDYASQTYQQAVRSLGSPEAITLAAQAGVVAHQRQAVLRWFLGLSPVGRGPTATSRDFAPAEPRIALISG